MEMEDRLTWLEDQARPSVLPVFVPDFMVAEPSIGALTIVADYSR